jgi:hypothetical protein
MNCGEFQDLFGLYWDLPQEDPRRILVDEHIETCSACREEFRIWQESAALIQSSGDAPDFIPCKAGISQKVMNKIYREESWRIPVSDRFYSISRQWRRNFALVMIIFLTCFTFSFVYSLLHENAVETAGDFSGVMPVASALNSPPSVEGEVVKLQGIPVASISDPIVLTIPVETSPDYLFALSLLGIVFVLLIINWWSRIKA